MSKTEQMRAEQRVTQGHSMYEQSHSMHDGRMVHNKHTIGGSGLLLQWHAGQGQG